VASSPPGTLSASGQPPHAIITTSGASSVISSGSTNVFKRTSTPRISISFTSQSLTPFTCRLVCPLSARFNCPPRRSVASNRTTVCPLDAETRAASRPAGPPPTITTFFDVFEGCMMCDIVCSRPVAAFCPHTAGFPWFTLSTQYPSPTHGLIRSSFPSRNLRMRCGSAMCARVIPTRSTYPPETA